MRSPPILQRVVRVASLHEADRLSREVRLESSVQDRFDAVEELRRVYFGYDDHFPRLERLLGRASLRERAVSADWGHALAFHAEARLTEDLDVFVEASPANAESLEESHSKQPARRNGSR